MSRIPSISKPNFTLRSAQPNDAKAIANLGSHIFSTTFGYSMPASDLEQYLQDSYSPSSIAIDIADLNVDFIVACDDNDQVVGFSQLRRGSFEECVSQSEKPVELQRLYVGLEHHGKGIARFLVENIEEMARDKGFKTLWLGVWEENPKAQKVYKRMGFVKVGEHDFKMGTCVQTDWIMNLQEDFCPPNGSLAVQNGRDIVPTVNKLLDLPFVIKIATKDWHPKDHISFASNHTGKVPFTDFVTVINPSNASESYQTRLWPDHCVQNSKGAEIIAEVDMKKIDKFVEKGTRREVEMYSAFYDPLQKPRVSDSGLAEVLTKKGITDVYVVGLAFDYCVKYTAIDAAKEGFKTVVVEEGTKAVDPSVWEEVKKELREKGVRVVSESGDEVSMVGKV